MLTWTRVGQNHWIAERGDDLFIIRRDSPFGDVFTVSYQSNNVSRVIARVGGVNAFEVAKAYVEVN